MLTTKVAQKQKKELQQQLFTAAKQGDTATILDITQKVANWPQMRDPTGRSLIDVARSRENAELVQLLQKLQAEALPTKRQLRQALGGPQIPRLKDTSPVLTTREEGTVTNTDSGIPNTVAVSLGSTQNLSTQNLDDKIESSANTLKDKSASQNNIARQLEFSPPNRVKSESRDRDSSPRVKSQSRDRSQKSLCELEQG